MLAPISSKLTSYWQDLNPRERLIIGLGSVVVLGLLFYSLIWKPWHHAIDSMQSAVSAKRVDLIWMQQQAELIKGGTVAPKKQIKGEGQSLLAVVEQTAKSAGVSGSIQQMVPRENNEVSVVLEEASFNKWIKWVGNLHQAYGVQIKQLVADRESGETDIAEIRVTFER